VAGAAGVVAAGAAACATAAALNASPDNSSSAAINGLVMFIVVCPLAMVLVDFSSDALGALWTE